MMKALLAVVIVLLFAPLIASAQSIILVPYDRAQIVWDAPKYGPATPGDQLPPGVGPTLRHILNCGDEDISLDLPILSVPVKAIAPKPGVFRCTLWAANDFGKSDPLAVPPFSAGNIPATPANTRIEVH